jgi:hypothetical protein
MRHTCGGVFLVGASLVCGAAFGANDGLYIGGSLGQSEEHFDASTYFVRSDDTAYKIEAGFRPLDVIAGEVDYVSFGRASGGVNYADTYGVGVFALGYLPIPVVDVYGRLGVVNWRTNVTSPYESFRRTGSDLAYGAGAGMSWGSLGVRLEYELYDVAHANTMNLATVGVTWSFL